jgi:hypothetical protein
MFIGNARGGYTRDGQQRASGDYLILMQPGDERVGGNNLRAMVRMVKMSQLGQFMMGTFKAGAHEVTVSGAYGSDGLPATVARELWELGEPLPDDLFEAWNNGGGWNGPGAEAEAMRLWAEANMAALKKPVRQERKGPTR